MCTRTVLRLLLPLLVPLLAGAGCASLSSGSDVVPLPADDGGSDAALADDGGSDAALAPDAARDAATAPEQAGDHALVLPPPGLSYASVPDSPTVRPGPAITLEAWVQVAESPSSIGDIVAKPYGPLNADSYVIWLQDGSVCAGVNVTRPEDALCTPWLTSGVWTHFAFTHDTDGREALYVDAVVAKSQSVATGPAYDDHPLLIGADIDAKQACCGLFGSIDEVRIYGVARDAAGVAADRDGAPPGPGILVYFPFDEGQGSTARDLASGLTATFSSNALTWGSGRTVQGDH